MTQSLQKFNSLTIQPWILRYFSYTKASASGYPRSPHISEILRRQNLHFIFEYFWTCTSQHFSHLSRYIEARGIFIYFIRFFAAMAVSLFLHLVSSIRSGFLHKENRTLHVYIIWLPLREQSSVSWKTQCLYWKRELQCRLRNRNDCYRHFWVFSTELRGRHFGVLKDILQYTEGKKWRRISEYCATYEK